MLSSYSRHIGEVLDSRDRNSLQADALFDQYVTLANTEEREAFVAALIHRMLTEVARRQPQQ